MTSILNRLRAGLTPILRLADAAAQILLFLMMALTVADVVLRKVSGSSILGAVEITGLMLAGVVFGGLARCEADDGHIRIEFVMRKASPRLRSAVDAATQLLCGLLFGAVTWALVRHAGNLRTWGEVTLDLGLPIHPFVLAAGIGCGLLSALLLLKSLLALADVRRR